MVRTTVLLVSVGVSIVVVIKVGIVPDSVHIVVVPLTRIEREIVDWIGISIVVVIAIDTITCSVAIEIGRYRSRVELIRTAEILIRVAPTIIIIVGIGIVADSVTIEITAFTRIVRECILFVGAAVAIGIRHPASMSPHHHRNQIGGILGIEIDSSHATPFRVELQRK